MLEFDSQLHTPDEDVTGDADYEDDGPEKDEVSEERRPVVEVAMKAADVEKLHTFLEAHPDLMTTHGISNIAFVRGELLITIEAPDTETLIERNRKLFEIAMQARNQTEDPDDDDPKSRKVREGRAETSVSGSSGNTLMPPIATPAYARSDTSAHAAVRRYPIMGTPRKAIPNRSGRTLIPGAPAEEGKVA